MDLAFDEAYCSPGGQSTRLDNLRKKPDVNDTGGRTPKAKTGRARKARWWNRLVSVKKKSRATASRSASFQEPEDLSTPELLGGGLQRQTKSTIRRKSKRQKKEDLSKQRSGFGNNLPTLAKRTGIFPFVGVSASAVNARRRWNSLSKHYCPKQHMDTLPRWSEGYACDPHECKRLFMTSHNLTALVKTLIKANENWMLEFVSIGGLEVFFQTMEQCFVSQPPILLWKAIGQVGCCRCLRKIMNLPKGLDTIVNNEYCITSLALGKEKGYTYMGTRGSLKIW